ncbi:MAG: hypothetical protein ACJA1A_002622 [Saprospiraceae bacterium]|jgi:hypothetical protein|tara:strand:+ start:62 stop:220 length:159 start_codon:yes stop_codon:yes gene_type:complete
MAQSKTEKRNAAKKVAEAKAQAKKAVRTTKPQGSAGGKVVKGKKPLTTAKKK